jgi:gliding motility-associated-like protein
MNRKSMSFFRIAFFLLFLTMAGSAYSQWKIDTTIYRSRCKEEPAGGGGISLSVSGVPGSYEYSWSNGGAGPSITDLVAGTYTVHIDNGAGKDTVVQYTVLQWQCDPLPALVFTPNGDGINDTWAISFSSDYPNLFVSLYNRWGQLVFEHKGIYTPWDGRNMLGLPVDPGVYYFIIYEDSGNFDEGMVTGSVTVIR